MPLVLIIEDVRTERLAAAYALTRAGHQVLEAASAEQGLEIVRRHHPDVIVCDVLMPGMNGYQFIAALRREEGIAGTPVIMLTAMAERAHMRLAMTAGADDYLPKPFSAAELSEAVSALVRKRQAQREEVVRSVKDKFMAALEEQKQSLASQYEMRFVRELNARWDRSGSANAEVRCDDSVVVLVELFGPLLSQVPYGPDMTATVRRAYERARDLLYLYGARHLLPLGNDLLAVFVNDPEAAGPPARQRAARAACALVRAVDAVLQSPAGAREDTPAEAAAPAPGATVALAEGTVTLLHMTDPLHGDSPSTLAAGDAVADAEAALDLARTRGWRFAAPQPLAESLAEWLSTTQTDQTPPGANRPSLQVCGLQPVPAAVPGAASAPAAAAGAQD